MRLSGIRGKANVWLQCMCDWTSLVKCATAPLAGLMDNLDRVDPSYFPPAASPPLLGQKKKEKGKRQKTRVSLFLDFILMLCHI